MVFIACACVFIALPSDTPFIFTNTNLGSFDSIVSSNLTKLRVNFFIFLLVIQKQGTNKVITIERLVIKKQRTNKVINIERIEKIEVLYLIV